MKCPLRTPAPRVWTRLSWCSLAILGLHCKDGAKSAELEPAPHAGGAAAPGPGQSDRATEPRSVVGRWAGTFTIERKTLSVEPAAAGEKAWHADPGTFVGEQALELTVASDGTVFGKSQGPLGAAVVRGHATNDRMTLSWNSSPEPGPSFSGTLLLLPSAEGEFEGELVVSSADSLMARKAEVRLQRSPGAPGEP